MNFCVCKGRQETEPLSAPLLGGGDSFWQCFLTAFICFPRLITTCILDSCTHMEFVGFLLVLGYASPLITCQSYFRYSISMPVKHLEYQYTIYIHIHRLFISWLDSTDFDDVYNVPGRNLHSFTWQVKVFRGQKELTGCWREGGIQILGSIGSAVWKRQKWSCASKNATQSWGRIGFQIKWYNFFVFLFGG